VDGLVLGAGAAVLADFIGRTARRLYPFGDRHMYLGYAVLNPITTLDGKAVSVGFLCVWTPEVFDLVAHASPSLSNEDHRRTTHMQALAIFWAMSGSLK
jgi:hypothetical protein